MSYYIFTANDIPVDNNRTIPVESIISTLVSNKIWLFSAHTPSWNKLRPGDKIMFYVCGLNRRYFGGSSIIDSHVAQITPNIKLIREKLGLTWFDKYVRLSDIRLFNSPIYIKELIPSLDFIKNKKNYGLNLRLPIVSIPEQDYLLVMSKLK